MMKLVVLALFLATAYSEAIKCFQKEGDEVVDKVCADAGATKCKGPAFTFAEGFSDYAFGCGECASGEAGCVDCAGASCNKVEELGKEYECTNYEWNADDTKFVANEAMTKCKSKASTEQNLCNKPGAEAKAEADFTKVNVGCGPCEVPEQKTAEKCAETNSAVSMTALLLPLIAAIYALF